MGLSSSEPALQPSETAPCLPSASTVLSLFSLAGKTAVVTGGTRGLGCAMAIALAEAGADIILVQVSVTAILLFVSLITFFFSLLFFFLSHYHLQFPFFYNGNAAHYIFHKWLVILVVSSGNRNATGFGWESTVLFIVNQDDNSDCPYKMMSIDRLLHFYPSPHEVCFGIISHSSTIPVRIDRWWDGPYRLLLAIENGLRMDEVPSHLTPDGYTHLARIEIVFHTSGSLPGEKKKERHIKKNTTGRKNRAPKMLVAILSFLLIPPFFPRHVLFQDKHGLLEDCVFISEEDREKRTHQLKKFIE